MSILQSISIQNLLLMNLHPAASCALHTVSWKDAPYEFYDEPTARRWCLQQSMSLPDEASPPLLRVIHTPAWSTQQFQRLNDAAQTEKDAHLWQCAPHAIAMLDLDTMRAALTTERPPPSMHFEWLKRMGFAAQSPDIADMLIKHAMQHPDRYAMSLYNKGGQLRWLMDRDPSFQEFCKDHLPKPHTNSKGYWPSLWVRDLLGMTLSYSEMQHASQCMLTLSDVGNATQRCFAFEGHLPAQVWYCHRAWYYEEHFAPAWSSLPLVRDYHRVLHGNFDLECPDDSRLFLLKEASHQRLSSEQFYAEVLRITQEAAPCPTPSILALPSIG